MKQLKTAQVFLSDDDAGRIYSVECIEHDKHTWLVTRWNEAPSQGWKVPARLVMLDNLPHQKLSGSGFQDDYLLQIGLPKAFFYDPNPPPAERPFVVVDQPPEIRVPIPGGIH
jgi:hypothetical protein